MFNFWGHVSLPSKRIRPVDSLSGTRPGGFKNDIKQLEHALESRRQRILNQLKGTK